MGARGSIEKQCVNCGKTFWASLKYPGRKCCSKKCVEAVVSATRIAGREKYYAETKKGDLIQAKRFNKALVTLTCVVCGTEFMRPDTHDGRKKKCCSPECTYKLKAQLLSIGRESLPDVKRGVKKGTGWSPARRKAEKERFKPRKKRKSTAKKVNGNAFSAGEKRLITIAKRNALAIFRQQQKDLDGGLSTSKRKRRPGVEAKKRYEWEAKCEYCGKSFVRKTYYKSKTCSRSCAAKMWRHSTDLARTPDNIDYLPIVKQKEIEDAIKAGNDLIFREYLDRKKAGEDIKLLFRDDGIHYYISASGNPTNI